MAKLLIKKSLNVQWQNWNSADMIFAELKDINKYHISEEIINFLNTLSVETPVGRYEIKDGVYANVDEYTTKNHEKCDLEAHKKYIDIQLLLSGNERIDFADIKGMSVKIPYDEKRDVMFFNLPEKVNTLYLKSGNFALFYPEDAHRPQMNSSEVSCKVKKVVVKILVV